MTQPDVDVDVDLTRLFEFADEIPCDIPSHGDPASILCQPGPATHIVRAEHGIHVGSCAPDVAFACAGYVAYVAQFAHVNTFCPDCHTLGHLHVFVRVLGPIRP